MDLTQFVQELRRRKVWRVTAIYLVAAWVLLQVSDVVVPAAGLPEWTVTLVLAGDAGLAPGGARGSYWPTGSCVLPPPLPWPTTPPPPSSQS